MDKKKRPGAGAWELDLLSKRGLERMTRAAVCARSTLKLRTNIRLAP